MKKDVVGVLLAVTIAKAASLALGWATIFGLHWAFGMFPTLIGSG